MSNGSWETIYQNQGQVQYEILNTVIEAKELFEEKQCKRILDLGCGTGRNTLYLAENGFEVLAVDISETGLEITKQKLIENNLINNVQLKVQDMFNMTLDNECCDGVLCVWVQGHGYKHEIQKSVDDVYNILKKDGIIVMDFVTVDDSTYGIGDVIDESTFVGGRPGEENIPHYYVTKEEVEEMFKKYNEVKLIDRTYRFNDDNGKEHVIEAVVVHAIK